MPVPGCKTFNLEINSPLASFGIVDMHKGKNHAKDCKKRKAPMSPVSMPEVPDKFFKPNHNPDNEPDDGAGPSQPPRWDCCITGGEGLQLCTCT